MTMARTTRPTNTEVVRLLDQVVRELADAKKRQQHLAAQVAKVGKALKQ